MNIAQLAQKLIELGVNPAAYRIGGFGRGNSDAIVVEQVPSGFEVLYTERGHNSLLASFPSEAEACAFVLAELSKDESYLAHNVGIFDTEQQASELAAKLLANGIRTKVDTVPVSRESQRYRVFVYGRDIEKVKKVRGW